MLFSLGVSGLRVEDVLLSLGFFPAILAILELGFCDLGFGELWAFP